MWLSNPAASPAFGPLAASLGGLLLAALGALAVIERGRWRESVLLRRWATWALIAPIYLLGVLSGPAVAALFVTALSVQVLREYATLVELPPVYRRLLLVGGLVPPGAALLGSAAHAAAPTLLVLAATLVPLLRGDVRTGWRNLAFTVLGWLYLPWLLSYLLLIQRDVPGGPEALVALGLAVALSDVGAYVVGRWLGRRKLAPTLSPSKTWGGVAGNLAGALLGLAVASQCWGIGAGDGATAGNLGTLALLGLGLVVAVGAVWGDLLESLLKREAGVKDAGAWLPGFGGLLDRLDSLVVVLPLSYYFLRWGLS